MSARLWTRTGRPRHNTVVIRGFASPINGEPLALFITGLRGSRNGKTGGMVQTYILLENVRPNVAVRTGADLANCGNCWHRGTPRRPGQKRARRRSCYVDVGQAPTSIWDAWRRGNVPEVSVSEAVALVSGRTFRLGSYGDPAMVPPEIWAELVSVVSGRTGYTHQYARPDLQEALRWCQVSADNAAQAIEAHKAGLGSFRVLEEEEEPLPFETPCPSADGVKCAECLMCHGNGAKNITIPAHGIGARGYRASDRRAVPLPVLN